jgi:hypothetical protein
MPRGGHFAAMEQPEALADDVRIFFFGRCAARNGEARTAVRLAQRPEWAVGAVPPCRDEPPDRRD